jgi:hypothetical protein
VQDVLHRCEWICLVAAAYANKVYYQGDLHDITIIIRHTLTRPLFFIKGKKKRCLYATQRNVTQRCAMQLAATKTVASQQPDQDSAAASDV